MTCKDCIHTDVCRLPFNTSETKVEFADVCHHFKNKADFVEVKHGEWIKQERKCKYYPSYKCSVCGYSTPFAGDNYCKVCGADMRKEGADNG